jgi:hypothetical protein
MVGNDEIDSVMGSVLQNKEGLYKLKNLESARSSSHENSSFLTLVAKEKHIKDSRDQVVKRYVENMKQVVPEKVELINQDLEL